MVLVEARSDQERYSSATPVGTFSHLEASARGIAGIIDFWAVWCPQERVFVESIWYLQFEAQNDANLHNIAHDAEHHFVPPHSAFPYHVTFQESESARSYPAGDDYGPPRTSTAGPPPLTTPEASRAAAHERPPNPAAGEQREHVKAHSHMAAAPANEAHADVPPTPPPDVAP
jgi:hypothetical protein